MDLQGPYHCFFLLQSQLQPFQKISISDAKIDTTANTQTASCLLLFDLGQISGKTQDRTTAGLDTVGASNFLVFYLLYCARTRLTPAEICYATSDYVDDIDIQDHRSPQRLRAICHGLFEIAFDQGRQHDVVIPCHETFNTFMLDPGSDCFESPRAAEMMGHDCLHYDAPVESIEYYSYHMNYDNHRSSNPREKRAFFQYAIASWIHHVKLLDSASAVPPAQTLRRICGEPFRRWQFANRMTSVI